ncbi:glycosyltransferase [Hymenobacter jeollabukensis]|uniref:Glycosyltransferase family 4 protein n=1 Tax=Hymenobacter jeollabukensis TaxID=2025313 RepID=A0A5R8WSX6_9BACT|nr:glycosyltransferase [Hymenobacter jeollabukensis]TLM94272.1 glycosyltransferase family 4 protein [Hymenobacter jeollabukensis]
MPHPPLPRVLMLPKWYPHRYDDQDGDFVARHVAAIAGHAEVAVLLATVARARLPQLAVCEADWDGPWPTLRYYYRARITGLAPLDKLLKLLLYFACVAHGYGQLSRRWGRPALVHVHVLLRTGVAAWLLRLLTGIPYLVTEHWTLYLPERSHLIGPARRWLTRLVVRGAAARHTVSQALGDAMTRLGFTSRREVVIANVVDTALFRPVEAPTLPEPNRPLLHVSAFHDSVKNLSGVLRVVAGLRHELPNLRLRVAGYGPDEARLHAYAAELGLLADGTVTFLGKLPHPVVAHEMQQAAALVSFSRAETFGCVLLEARACGCPVVATRTGGVPELFEPAGAFGLLVAPDDEAALAAALRRVLTGQLPLNPAALRADADHRCSPAAVGRAFADLYSAILSASQAPR